MLPGSVPIKHISPSLGWGIFDFVFRHREERERRGDLGGGIEIAAPFSGRARNDTGDITQSVIARGAAPVAISYISL